ncbi:DUF262 domain-containing protein [Actinomycetospora sp. CA-053990]|uniref:DUF262 domain-containing protein n=1 Tax=Actinomycetospora sp. CA-053990 TaxID=3239891 RepID=UPI003D8B1884
MAFQTPITVEEMLRGIHRQEYVLPAIQREFVWDTTQIRRLVDSLMRGYPIGSFLVWDVDSDTARGYTFYDFVTNYHERDTPYATKATVPSGNGAKAILDGQQRLTALNIAVYGSHAEKKKYAWWTSPEAFPRKRLYLNLLEDSDQDDLGLNYDLRFLTDEEAKPGEGEAAKWYPIRAILTLEDSGPAAHDELAARHIDLNDRGAYRRLHALFQAIRVKTPLNYFLETSQDSDKVLDIFVRVNSGGTELSYSDLLLSMATNQWDTLDAREEVRSAVQELNTKGARLFAFNKDHVLKTALMISGVDLRFKVSNFTRQNMARVEKGWEESHRALVRAANLLSGFGFSGRTLTAHSVVVPIAYYLYKRSADDSYLDAGRYAEDRRAIQRWVTRSLVKRGIWGSGLDGLLARIRGVLDEHGSQSFPVFKLEHEMAALGKSLAFEPTEIDELLQLKWGGQRTFAVLTLLYPGLDLSSQFHEDHIFPRSRFTRRALRQAGVPADQIDDHLSVADMIPNLQLLKGVQNMEKQAVLPGEWLHEVSGMTSEQSSQYIVDNDLIDVPGDFGAFMNFFEARRARMRARLMNVLGVLETV